ncbi:hypothetical protein O3M35_003043 [Rhynocoris fuscipes]|uniref:UDP-glucuronosyltransferase n=1 Tax=Rhynocoris fuscipes TaxID=488301 RepID=A0AAW1CHR1_9HEMI
MKLWLPVLLLAYAGQEVEMANILALFPLPLYSHTSNFIPIFKALAARGHNVTVVSPFPQKQPVPNLTDIVVDVGFNVFTDTNPIIDLTKVSERYFQLVELWRFGDRMTEVALQLDIVQKLIKDQTSKFDLIMIETYLFQEPFLAFGYKFKAPVVNIHPSILPASAALYTGNHVPFSYSPGRFSSFSHRMTFLERVESTFFHIWDILMTRVYLAWKQDYLMRKYLQPPELPELPPITEMLMNTSLTLVNHNSAIGYPYPLHKNVVEFGGANVKAADKLPEDLQQIMDKAKDGVVFLSFGTFLNITTLSPSVQVAIVNALGKLKQTVLVKWVKPTHLNIDIPKNIIFREWYPQPSILAHPNCKLFISHCGVRSLLEAVYHGVPMVLVPLFADQKYNAKFVEINGYGRVLNLKKLTEDKLSHAINTVLNNPGYKERIMLRSAVFKDNPIDIMDNVVYWIEYVIRHKGAPHLRPAVLDLYWFQAFCLDVIAFYLFLIIFIIFALIKIVSLSMYCIKLMFKKKEKSEKSKKE